MNSRRQPSEQFLRRLKGDGGPSKAEAPEVRPSWIRKCRESDVWLWAEVVLAAAGLTGFIFLVPTGYALWVDLEDRQTQRVVQAWQLVTQNAPGNSGKGPALGYLNSQGIPLVGIDLSVEDDKGGSYLMKVDLSGALLASANLSRANLYKADLSGARLFQTDLSGAALDEADLSGTILFQADLSGASLDGADLSRANLYKADLSGASLRGADLRKVKNLSQKMLDCACGDKNTQLPKGLTIRKCPKSAFGMEVSPTRP